MARLYADENFPHPVVDALRERGHDVVTLQEDGRAGEGVTDADVLRTAVQDERAVVTLNRRDFIALHNASSEHAGIIVCTADSDFTSLADRVDAALADRESLAGTLIRVNRPSN